MLLLLLLLPAVLAQVDYCQYDPDETGCNYTYGCEWNGTKCTPSAAVIPQQLKTAAAAADYCQYDPNETGCNNTFGCAWDGQKCRPTVAQLMKAEVAAGVDYCQYDPVEVGCDNTAGCAWDSDAGVCRPDAATKLQGLPGLPIGPDSRGMMQCPRSKSPVHAYGKITVAFKDSCKKVQDEINARVAGMMDMDGNPWADPHNMGTYMALGMGEYQDYEQIETMRTAHGFPKFHDKQYFTFVDTPLAFVKSGRGGGGGSGGNMGCTVYACSVSQGVSATDGGTNFCNLHDLYCGTLDNCKIVKSDLHYQEQHVSVNIGSRHNKWICTGKPPRYELHEDPVGLPAPEIQE